MTPPGDTTSAVRLNSATITQYLASQAARLRPGKRRSVLLRAAAVWDGPAELTWADTRKAQVRTAPSALAVYELVLGHVAPEAPGPEVLVVLTDREEAELGPDVLAKVHRQRVNAVDTWDVVRESFAARGTDTRLLEDNWAAESLLDATPPGGWPALRGGMLSRRGALTALALRRLGIGRYDPDLDLDTSGAAAGGDILDVPALLTWSLVPGGPERFLALRAPERDGLKRFLGGDDQAGEAGQALFALVSAEHGADAVAFGLLCAALWEHADPAADADVYRARGRAERWFGEDFAVRGDAFDSLAMKFGRACEAFVSGLLIAGRTGAPESDESAARARRLHGIVLDRAATLVQQFGAEMAERKSPLLRAGLEARFAEVGESLLSGSAKRTSTALDALDAHRLAPGTDEQIRIGRARMALRLMQWLATAPKSPAPTVPATVSRHMAETGWVDMALEHVQAGGDPDPVLKSSYDRLCASVRTARREIDREFALALAEWTASGRDPGAMLTVETFLPRVVAPVAKAGKQRVLLLVLDGMSAAIAAELGEELRKHWSEYDPLPGTNDEPQRRAMAAALPTVTAVSRTSLFAARLMRGTQAQEKQLFPAHRFWGDGDAAVFHKDDLRADTGGEWLGPELLEALSSDRTHVAVVLNTVDDRLSSEQKLGDGAWRLSDIGALRVLLRHAAAQGLAVLLTSDHGHVIDRYGVRVHATGVESARHRTPGEPVSDVEVRLAGPRVVAPEPGGEIIALWDPDARYSAQRAGYHGGAALAEFTIPVLAFLPFGATPPKDWRELGNQQPPWWQLGAQAPARQQSALLAPVQTAAKKPAKRTKAEAELAKSHDSLFDVAPVPDTTGEALFGVGPVSPDDALVAALLASEIFESQVEMLARKPDLVRVEQAVRTLLDAGGTLPMTALAQRVNLPSSRRVEGFAAVLRQLLNYDGVQVLETLPDGRTLRLSTARLREQFELG
ncbi:BREX-2 system phosphatase PglZ [Streptomyces virginiae]|uniref:BREX-2 system phosphatase PglZ n=1 Tax=Streptomyces virginiae TaxID=1961 RepID=UPI003862D854|nr:BREX-2 system phosphatase PglZ [Streptomyces virginiae]